MGEEPKRLEAEKKENVPWKKWGPYLSERQWGTVREHSGGPESPWNSFPHGEAHFRTYRWGEDGIAGICDDRQLLCFALALWNGKDRLLKERLFGLTNEEGNHGEDVKEYYYYLDCTPTHSYMKYLYKYPQNAYPYEELVRVNEERGRQEREYELIDTGIFDENRYFDVWVEYAKGSPEDILIQITIQNQGPERVLLHVLPTLWFRNTWSWGKDGAKPILREFSLSQPISVISAFHPALGNRYLYCSGDPPLFFAENETNPKGGRGQASPTPYFKDGIHEFLVQGIEEAVNPEGIGTKASAYYRLELEAGESRSIRLRLTDVAPSALGRVYRGSNGSPFGREFEEIWEARKKEADEFYQSITPPSLPENERQVLRQAMAGLLWSKQYYFLDQARWLKECESDTGSSIASQPLRNAKWRHLGGEDILCVPDKWESPWFASWDLAFHSMALAGVDLDFAKQQLEILLGDSYLHPSGQIPACEWNFGDVYPPVHALAALDIYQREKELREKGDLSFLRRIYAKLLTNFTFWANLKDRHGQGFFDGGFIGVDGIGLLDRKAPLPGGGFLEQTDGLAWMALFCQNMLEMSLELSLHEAIDEDLALKFFHHFFALASAFHRIGGGPNSLWNEEDGFFYDFIRFPDGTLIPMKARGMGGLLPLCATVVWGKDIREKLPGLMKGMERMATRHPPLWPAGIDWQDRGVQGRECLSLLNEERLRRVLQRMLSEEEFLSPFGIRSLSRWHWDHPWEFQFHGEKYRVGYEPAESRTGNFGGNCNWRGPVWFPMNWLIIRALLQFYLYYGEDFRIECPTGSGTSMSLFQVAMEIARRLIRIFLRAPSTDPGAMGRRPVFGDGERFQTDPHWRDHLLFFESFNGEDGSGLGASHQTGWTALVGRLILMVESLDAQGFLSQNRRRVFYHPE